MSQISPDDGLVPATQLTAQVTEVRFKRVLGIPSLVLFGLVYMVPLTVFTTYGIVTQLTGGRLVDAYLITLVVMLFTARSYARMSTAMPYSGSAYVYTQQSFGGAIGFIVGCALLLDYLFLPMINYLVLALYMNQALPALPNWVWVVLAIAVVTVLNVIGITQVARANFVIIAVQTIFIALFIVFSIVTMSGHHIDILAPITGDGTAASHDNGALFNGAAILALSFLGFDAVSTLSEEAKDAKRDVPRAIMIVTLGAGILFIVLSYVSQLLFPGSHFKDVNTASTEVIAVAGQWLAVLFTAGYVAGCLGSALTSQASVSRILFAMGRDGVLPRRVFGHLNVRFGTPVVPILIVSAISLIAIWIDLATLTNMISFGALIAFSFVNLSVVVHFYLRGKERGGWGWLNNLVLPIVGFGLTVWLWTSLAPITFAIGGSWLVVGFVILLIVTRFFSRPTPMLDLKE